MGQINSVNRLPENLRNKINDLLDDPSLPLVQIVTTINSEAGKPVVSKSSLSRYEQRRQKFTGKRRGMKVPNKDDSLYIIAKSLERIAVTLEKQ